MLCLGNGDEACNSCPSCNHFDDQQHLDYHEIDGALNSNVDNMREVIEVSNYQPQISRKRVFLLDESHRLSLAAFSAILKTLEESSDLNHFILTTTHPEKLPDSIVSRSIRLKLVKPSVRELQSYLANLLPTMERDDALDLISIAQYRVRDLNNLIEMFRSVGNLSLLRYLLGVPRRSLVRSY